MGEINQLHHLEDVDISLAEVCRLREVVKAALLDHSDITRVEAEIEIQKQRLSTAEREKRSVEAEIQDLEERKKTLQNKAGSGSVKNSKELIKLDNELKRIETTLREKDEAALAAMASIDEMRRVLDQENKKLAELQSSQGRRSQELETQLADIEKRIAILEKQREKLAAGISPDKLDIYRTLRASMNGRVVAAVERGFCLGCHISLPSSAMSNLERGGIIRCSTCGRILYRA